MIMIIIKSIIFNLVECRIEYSEFLDWKCPAQTIGNNLRYVRITFSKLTMRETYSKKNLWHQQASNKYKNKIHLWILCIITCINQYKSSLAY